MKTKAARLMLIIGTALLAQCMDQQPLAPIDESGAPAPRANTALLTCRGSSSTREIICTSDEAGSYLTTGSPLSIAHNAFGSSSSVVLPPAIIVGGQNTFVTLASSGLTIGGGVFEFDVTVKNLIPQAMGTNDGTTPTAEGVRVFFHQQPTITSGVGTISIANADGTETFMSAGQPYYQYDGILDPNEVSAPRHWKFNFTGTITFEFKVFVWAPVRYPNGWVIVTPASDQLEIPSDPDVQLSGSVVDAVGRAVTSPPAIVWSSSNESAATVDAGGMVTAVGAGSTTITATADTYVGEAAITVIGAVDHFLVEAAAGGNIGTQASGVAFDIKITAQDAANQTVTGFTGTVDLTSTPAGLSLTSGAFTAGVLASQSVTIAAGGSYTITATRTGGSEAGTSNNFDVTAVSGAVADEVAGGSAPNDSYHTPLNTALSIPDGSLDLLANDNRGFPLANVSHFGAVQCNNGSGTFIDATDAVTANAAGASVSLNGKGGCTGGSLQVNADGTLTFTPTATYTGLFRFQYRIANSSGTSDAQVTLAVGVRPAAGNDTYSGGTLIANVTLNTNTGTPYSVSTNDAGDQRVIAINTPVAASGTYTLDPNGTFLYQPAAGFSGAAGFTYDVTNGFGTVTGTAGITVGTSRVWFVDQAVGVSGTGTQASPFKNISNITNSGALPNPQDGDVIFVFQNATSYTGAFTLRASQKLVGQDASASLQTISGFTPAEHQALPAMDLAAPAVTLTSSGTTVTLGTNNTLRGFTLGDATTSALTGNGFGTLTLGGDVAINNSTGMALSLTTGAISGNLASVSSTGGTNNVLLSAVTGTTDFGTGTLASATDAGLSIVGGTVSLTYGGNISGSAGIRVLVSSGHNTGTLVLTGQVSATGGPSGLAFVDADGIYDLGGLAAGSTLNGGDAAVDIGSGSSGTFTFGSNLSITNPIGPALTISGSTPAGVTFNGAISTNTSKPVSISGIPGSCGTITVAGSITTTGQGILVENCTGGTVTFSGASKSLTTGTNTGVLLFNNAGGTINFSNGGLGITTTTGLGFRAFGGGTVSVGGASNTIAINGAQSGLWLANMTVGAAGVAFNSITSINTATGSPVCLQSLSGSGAVTLTTVSIAATSAGPGVCIGGSPPVTIGTATIDNTAGAGIEIASSTGAVAVNAGSIGGTNDPTGNVVDVDGGNANVTIAANLTKSTAGRIAEVTNHTAGTVTFSGSLNCSGSCTGINVGSNTGGTIEFTNATKTINTGANAAVTLANNTGATVNFSGNNLDIDVTSGTGFTATGGGTVNVTGTNNTVATTGGIGVNIQNTTIGANHLTFQSINKGASTAFGIRLENTGTSGGLKVTGTGAANSGGILNQNGATATDSAAITLNSTSSIDLDLMRINITTSQGQTGIAAINLQGTNRFARSVIDYNNTAAGGAIHGYYGARFVQNNAATITLDAVTIEEKLDGTTAGSLSAGGSGTVNFNVIDSNTGDGFPSLLQGLFGSGWVISSGDTGGSTVTVNATVSNTTFQNSAANGTNNLELGANANSTLNYKIKSNLFSSVTKASFIAGVINMQSFDNAVLGGTTAMDSIVGNTIQNIGTGSLVADLGYIPIRIAPQPTTAQTNRFVIANNTITNVWRQGMLLSTRLAATGHFKVINNVVGTIAAPVGQSGRRGLETDLQDNSVMNLEATGNTFTTNSTLDTRAAFGIRVGTNTGSATLNATVVSNTMQSTNGAGNNGRFSAESAATGTGTLCLDVRQNTLDAVARLFTLNQTGGTFRVEGAGVGAVSNANITGANTVGTGNVLGTVLFNNGANCTQPPI